MTRTLLRASAFTLLLAQGLCFYTEKVSRGGPNSLGALRRGVLGRGGLSLSKQWKKYLTQWPDLKQTRWLAGRSARARKIGVSPYIRKLARKVTNTVLKNPLKEVEKRLLFGLDLHQVVPKLGETMNVIMKKPSILPNLARTISRHLISNTVGTSDPTPGEDRGPEETDFKPTPGLVEEAGFLSEEHPVVTEDGYVLTVHRIVNTNVTGRDKPVVFLQHGLLCSSSDWVIGDRAKAFGFLLADAGYDVWLGNFRGNMYSREHIILDPAKEEFWEFSWDQMGAFDLPAMLSMVLRVTGQSDLIYVGHSMGTTAFWVMMNNHPHLNSLVSLMIAMAPVAATPHMHSPIKYIAPVANEVERVLKLTGQYEFWSRGSMFADLSETLCNEGGDRRSPRNESACSIPENIIFSLAGFDEPQMNFTLLPTILAHTPAGTSSRTVLHFAQSIQTARFQKFDFGDDESNLAHYGTTDPPLYHLPMVTCPVALFWGENDWLAHPKDVAVIADQLPNLVANIRVPYDSWNHLDFLWGKDADNLLYSPAMDVMSYYTGQTGRDERNSLTTQVMSYYTGQTGRDERQLWTED